MCKKLHNATICFDNLLRVNSPKHTFSLWRWAEKCACYRVVNSVCETHARALTGREACFLKPFARLTLLKPVLLFYKTPLKFRSILAKIDALKHSFMPYFQSFTFYFTVFLSVKVSICTFLPFYLVPRSQFFVVPKTSFSIQKVDFWRYFHQN